MPVAVNHFLRLVPHPFINYPLVNACRRAVRGKTVPQDMPATQHGPATPLESTPKMVMGFVARHSDGFFSMRLAADHFPLTEQVLPARVNRQPIAQDRLHECRQRHTPRCPPSASTLLFMQKHRPRSEIHVIHPYPKQLAPPCSGVSCQASHWIEERLGLRVVDMLEQLLDLRPRQKQRVPKLAYLSVR